jgi:hypothetical protein
MQCLKEADAIAAWNCRASTAREAKLREALDGFYHNAPMADGKITPNERGWKLFWEINDWVYGRAALADKEGE